MPTDGIRATRDVFDPALARRDEMMDLRLIDLAAGYGVAALVAGAMVMTGQPEVAAGAVFCLGGTAATLLLRFGTVMIGTLRNKG